jgi:hypothetical protein
VTAQNSMVSSARGLGERSCNYQVGAVVRSLHSDRPGLKAMKYGMTLGGHSV